MLLLLLLVVVVVGCGGVVGSVIHLLFFACLNFVLLVEEEIWIPNISWII